MGAAKKLGVAAGSLAMACGIIGVLHMPFARNLLMDVGGCPVGHASTAEMEPTVQAALAAARGDKPAPSRPALGFELDKTTRADALAWAAKVGVSCTEVRDGLMSCNDVPAKALGLPDADGPATELHLGFNTKGTLDDVATMRMHADAKPAADIAAHLEAAVGEPQHKTGSFDDDYLAKNFRISTVTYRYSDYMAEVIALRMQDTGLVLREHYRSATD